MNLKKMLLGGAAATLVAMPAVAQVATLPAVAPLAGDESELKGSPVLLGLLAGAAIIGAIIVIADDDDDPVSG